MEYNLEIHHIKGTSNGQADVLSWWPDYNQGEDNNKDVVVLPDQLFLHSGQVQVAEEVDTSQILQVKEMTLEHPVYEQDEEMFK